MSDNMNTKCPYCGSSLLQEEDGYRCRFCKSFFPFGSDNLAEEGDSRLSDLKQHVIEQTDDAAAAEKIRQSGAAMALVCLGAPKQEFFMHRFGEATGARLLLGLGGSLDVFAGVAQRAPKFFCDHGLEWFYRLAKQPSRIGRMMRLPLFLVHVAKEKRK